jgi:hypothetical protein
MISVMMLVVVTTVFAKVVVGMLNDHRHVPPSHFAVASMRASPLLRGPLAYLLRNRLLLEARLYVLSLKRRLTLDVTARVTRIGRAEPQTRRASRGPA